VLVAASPGRGTTTLLTTLPPFQKNIEKHREFVNDLEMPVPRDKVYKIRCFKLLCWFRRGSSGRTASFLPENDGRSCLLGGGVREESGVRQLQPKPIEDADWTVAPVEIHRSGPSVLGLPSRIQHEAVRLHPFTRVAVRAASPSALSASEQPRSQLSDGTVSETRRIRHVPSE
jgi:hypothetical protein